MGLAIIVPDVDFSDANLGRVSILDPSALYGVTIIGNSQVTGGSNAATYDVTYSPSSTEHTGVTWSIVSGGSYATIDASTGVLSVLSGANNSQVVIRATSTYDNTIYADKTIAVTYSGPIEDLTNYLDFGNGTGYFVTDIVVASTDSVKIVFSLSANGSYNIFGSRSFRSRDDNSMIFENDASGSPFKYKNGGTMWKSANTPSLNTKYVFLGTPSGVECTPSAGTWAESSYAYSEPLPIYIGTIYFGDAAVDSAKFFHGKLYGMEVYGSDNSLKHRLIPQSDGTLKDEVTNTSYSVTGSVIYG